MSAFPCIALNDFMRRRAADQARPGESDVRTARLFAAATGVVIPIARASVAFCRTDKGFSSIFANIDRAFGPRDPHATGTLRG